MENFKHQLEHINIEPKSTSWLKLENRLQDQNKNTSNKRTKIFYISSIAASFVILLIASFIIIERNPSLLQIETKPNVQIESSFANDETEYIYNIKQLSDLNLAYQQHGLKMN